jgi:adenylyltransferase/sulfurtransferase
VKPLVYGAIYKFEGQVSVFNYKGGPTLRCLYPTTDVEKSVPDSESIGVIGVLPGIIGSLQANEVLKIILQKGEVLSGKLFIMDILDNRNYTVDIKTNPENLKIKEIN